MRLLVIGGGPGGYVAAIRGAQLGAEVTLVEKGELGGTCLNVGCIPTKVLLHATEVLEGIKHADALGISVSSASLDCEKLQAYKTKIVKQLTGGVAGLLKGNKVTVYKGSARFEDRYTAKVSLEDGKTATVPFDKVVIASGSETVVIPVPGSDLPCVVGSDEALSFTAAPASMVIIGGGVIGVELATVYARMGSKITIVEALDRILPNMDKELTDLVARTLKKLKIDVFTSCKVTGIKESGGTALVTYTAPDGSEKSASGEKVLMSVGRRPYTKGLNLEALGLEMDRSSIKVDDYMRTSVPGVYAIGDCTGGMMLAHVSSAQAAVAAENAVHGDKNRYDAKTVPGCVYTEPELASVGLTEEKARQQYPNVKVGKFNLGANGKTMLMGGSGLVKYVVDGDTEEVLGLHILGPRATDMIVEGALALRLEATIEEIITTIHAHPTVAEALGEAAEDVRGLAIHKM